jgi:hypothetical protein
MCHKFYSVVYQDIDIWMNCGKLWKCVKMSWGKCVEWKFDLFDSVISWYNATKIQLNLILYYEIHRTTCYL